MRVAFLVGPKMFQLRNVPDLVAPADGLVLKVCACGVCGSDLRRWREGPTAGVDNSIVPGHEVAGVVVEVGSQVQGYVVGDHIALAPDIHCGQCYYCKHGQYNLCDNMRLLGITPGYWGGFADKMMLTRETLTNGIVHRMPTNLSFDDAALSEPLSSVLSAHEQLGASLGDTVVVIGAGPIGCLHIAVAKARGARVIVSQRSETRRLLARFLVPDAILDRSRDIIVARVRELTDGVGADAVICANGVAETVAQAVEMTRKGGTVVLFGGLPRANPLASFNANLVHYGEIRIIGAFSYLPTTHALALDVLARRIIPTEKLVTHRFSLEQIAQAFEVADSGSSLKVLVAPESECVARG